MVVLFGIGPLQFLCRLEQDIGRKIPLISAAYAGTSTGSIIAAGLNEGYSAHELFELYKKNLKAIFTKYSWYKRLDPKCPTYDNRKLKDMLKDKFKGKIGDWKKPIYIPTTVMNRRICRKSLGLGR